MGVFEIGQMVPNCAKHHRVQTDLENSGNEQILQGNHGNLENSENFVEGIIFIILKWPHYFLWPLFIFVLIVCIFIFIMQPPSGANTEIFLGGAKCSRSEHRTRQARSNLSWGVCGGGRCKPPSLQRVEGRALVGVLGAKPRKNWYLPSKRREML